MNTQEPASDEKLHYYAFSYYHSEGSEITHATAYTGFKYKKVTYRNVSENKEYAGVPSNACLIAISYMGYMTNDEVYGK